MLLDDHISKQQFGEPLDNFLCLMKNRLIGLAQDIIQMEKRNCVPTFAMARRNPKESTEVQKVG
jgi:hypothetical protein